MDEKELMFNIGDRVELLEDVEPFTKGDKVEIIKVDQENGTYDIVGINGPDIWIKDVPFSKIFIEKE